MAYGTKKFPLLLILGFVLVFGVALGYGYYYSQVSAVNSQIEGLDREIVEVQNQLDQLRSSEVVTAQRAINAMDLISKDEVKWSEVLDVLIKITPLDLVEKKPLVDFTSYSGSEGGLLSFNGRTNPSRDVKGLLNDIAKTIETFNENPDFADAFVPSISKSVSEEDESLLSFIFSVSYNPSESTSEESESSVPRR